MFVTTPTAHREDDSHITIRLVTLPLKMVLNYNFNLLDEETGFNFDDYWTDNAHVNTIRKIFIRES